MATLSHRPRKRTYTQSTLELVLCVLIVFSKQFSCTYSQFDGTFPMFSRYPSKTHISFGTVKPSPRSFSLSILGEYSLWAISFLIKSPRSLWQAVEIIREKKPNERRSVATKKPLVVSNKSSGWQHSSSENKLRPHRQCNSSLPANYWPPYRR